MSIFARRFGLALVLVALAFGGRTAHAQTAAYSSWPLGFASNLTVGQSADSYGNFAGLDGNETRGGFSYMRTNFPNGWFVGGASGPAGLTGINQAGAFGSSLYREGMTAGYKFQNDLPFTVYAGFETLKYKSGLGANPFAPFDTASGTLPGYSAHAGVEFQAAPNVSLSLGVGYTQAPGRLDSELSLPGASPFGIRR